MQSPDWDFASWDIATITATHPIYPTVDLAVTRNGSAYSAKITYSFPTQATADARYLTLAVLPQGKEQGSTLLSLSNLSTSGTIVQALPAFDTDRTLRATASACDGVATADASISCTHC